MFIFLLVESLFLVSLHSQEGEKAAATTTEEVKKLTKLTYAQKEEKASELLESSKQAKHQGLYDEAITFANESSRISKEIEEYKNIKKRHNWLWFRMAVAKHVGVKKQDPKSYNQAYQMAEEGKQRIKTEDLPNAKNVIEEAIVLIDKAIEAARKSLKGKGDIVVSQKKDGSYEVRYLPGKRDCLWRIASYDFIYNDALKWQDIYKANKSIIKNPNLIYPGQVFIIPSLEGAIETAKNTNSTNEQRQEKEKEKAKTQKSQTNYQPPVVK